METIKSRSLFSSLVLSSVIAIAVLVFLEICLALTLNFKDYVHLATFNIAWWQISLLILWGLFVAFAADKLSLKRLLPFTVIFLLVYLSLSFYLAVYWGINIFFVRVFCVTLLTILAVHLKKLWQIDSELTDRLVNLASTGHLLEVKSAEMRIESGLKLLETVLKVCSFIKLPIKLVMPTRFSAECVEIKLHQNLCGKSLPRRFLR